MAAYKSSITSPFNNITSADKLSNQVVLSGTDETYLVKDGTFLLDYLDADGGTVTIKDGDGNTIISGLSTFQDFDAPIRCDKGIQITGDVVIAKGSAIYGIFVA